MGVGPSSWGRGVMSENNEGREDNAAIVWGLKGGWLLVGFVWGGDGGWGGGEM